jgi:hypothetical protein
LERKVFQKLVAAGLAFVGEPFRTAFQSYGRKLVTA